MNHPYHVEVARKAGFRPYDELTDKQQESVCLYCDAWYDFNRDSAFGYWWKESSQGDGNWISYDVRQHNRINAPHLVDK